MTVNILMPAYGAACFIGHGPGSLSGQAYADFEVVVVADRSRDTRVRLLSIAPASGVTPLVGKAPGQPLPDSMRPPMLERVGQ